MRRVLPPVLAFVLGAVTVNAQTALTYPHLVVFGDNYSDTLNTYDATRTISVGYDQDGDPITLIDAYPSSAYGYGDGIFTNAFGLPSGPSTQYSGVWHQQLHTLLPGIPLATPAGSLGQPLTGNNNYAWGSATTGSGFTSVTFAGHLTASIHNLGQQVNDYLNAGNIPDARSLYVLFGGLNDLLADSSAADSTTAAANVTAQAKRLIDAGAVNVLVANVPGISSNPASPIDTAAAAFRTQLAMDLASLQAQYSVKGTTVHLIPLDLYTLYANIMAKPAAFGFTDVTDKADAVNANGNYPSNLDNYLNWDGVNPTTAGHHQIALATCTALTGTQTTLAIDKILATPAQPATLTATVSTAGTYGPQSALAPTGTVTFYYPQTILTTTTMVSLGSAPVGSNGQASISTASLPSGVYTVYAVYSGDANFPTGCNSATQTFTVAVAAVSFDFTPSPTGTYIGMEESADLTLTPAPIGGFTGPVTFSCGALPRFFGCNFISNQTVQITGNGTITVSQLLITTKPGAVAQTHNPAPLTHNTGADTALAALFTSPLLLLMARRSKLPTLRQYGLLTIILALSIAVISATGCGVPALPTLSSTGTTAPGGPGTAPTAPTSGFGITDGPGINYAAPGTYSVNITATSGSLSVTHTYYIYIADTYDVGVTP
jgi:phospholipase/lecithinase/hemolysin